MTGIGSERPGSASARPGMCCLGAPNIVAIYPSSEATQGRSLRAQKRPLAAQTTPPERGVTPTRAAAIEGPSGVAGRGCADSRGASIRLTANGAVIAQILLCMVLRFQRIVPIWPPST